MSNASATFSAPDSEALAAALVAAIEAELAALADEDADAIIATSAAKAEALAAVQAAMAAGAPCPRPLLERARTLNSEAILRSRAKMIAVEKRLAALRPELAAARPATLVYGRDGRWA
jgi:hypothetical protein